MKEIYFTITGTKYRYGHDFLKPGMKVKLEKEPDKQFYSQLSNHYRNYYMPLVRTELFRRTLNYLFKSRKLFDIL